MTKEQILDEINDRFLEALIEKHESFSIALSNHVGQPVLRISGTRAGCETFSYDLLIDMEGGGYIGPSIEDQRRMETKRKRK